MKSIFSKIIDRELPADIVAENDRVIVIKDINPKAPVHLLIVPKKEIRDIQSFGVEDFVYAEAIFKMAQELSRSVPGAEEFRLQVNSGYRAGQRVFHVHAHFLAGAEMTD